MEDKKEWRPGDVVVCVNAKGPNAKLVLTLNKTYEIEDIKVGMIKLEDVTGYWSKDRFITANIDTPGTSPNPKPTEKLNYNHLKDFGIF